MALWLKQSTAATIKLGPFVDSTDGVTSEIGLTIAQADVRLSKNGGNMAQKNEVTSATHDEIGYYDVNLDATDTNTLGRLKVMVSEAGALPVWQDYMVMPANVYDSLVGGSDYLQTDVIQIEGTDATDQITTAATASLNSYDPPTRAELTTDTNSILSKLLKYVQLILRSDAAIATDNATELTAINADGGSGVGSFSNQTDSEEALRNHIGDGTNLTEAGGTGDHLTAIDLPNQTMDITGNITGNLSGSVGSVTGAVGSVVGNVGGNVTGSVGSVVGGLNTGAGVITTLDGLDTAQDVQHTATQADTQDIQTRLPAALVGGKMNSDATAINSSTAAAVRLALSAGTIVSGSAIAGTLSTTQMSTDLTEATDNHYNGRVIIWTSGVLQNQATAITNYDGPNKILTFTAVTEAPSANDTFVLV